jgi:hypothetical protein
MYDFNSPLGERNLIFYKSIPVLLTYLVLLDQYMILVSNLYCYTVGWIFDAGNN